MSDATPTLLEFMREGGWGMWPILALGLLSLASAIRTAIRPEPGCFRFVGALWCTLLVAVVHASVTDLAAVFHYLEDAGRASDPQLPRLLLAGLKESTRPAALGGIFLTLTPLLIAVAIYRQSSPSSRPS